MARKHRSCPRGLIFHLCNRAAGDLTLFKNPYDYLQILQTFREAMETFPISLYAYCMMPNHWHLLVRPHHRDAISRFMHWFGTTHATRYRKSHESVGQGALYQNRFRSHPVEGSAAFFKTAAYIERNPLSAGLVAEAPAWPWSSAAYSPILSTEKWPFPKPANWSRLVAQPTDPGTLQQIRYAKISAQIFRIPQLENQTGLRSAA